MAAPAPLHPVRHIGCCDTSPSQHATAHAKETGHPVIRSFEPGEAWFWSLPERGLLRDRPGPRRARITTRGSRPSLARRGASPRDWRVEAQLVNVVTRGFTGRRRDDPKLPPGQYLEHGFPVLQAGPPRR